MSGGNCLPCHAGKTHKSHSSLKFRLLMCRWNRLATNMPGRKICISWAISVYKLHRNLVLPHYRISCCTILSTRYESLISYKLHPMPSWLIMSGPVISSYMQHIIRVCRWLRKIMSRLLFNIVQLRRDFVFSLLDWSICFKRKLLTMHSW